MSDDLEEIYKKLSPGYFFYPLKGPCCLEDVLKEEPANHIEHEHDYVLLQKMRDESGGFRPQPYGSSPVIIMNGRPKSFSVLSINSNTVTLDQETILGYKEFSKNLRPVSTES